MDDVRNAITHVGSRIRRALSRLSVLSWIALILALGTVIGLAVAASVSDSFTDTAKIASSVNLTVDTTNGQVKLAVSSSWTCGNTIVDSRDGKTYTTVLIGTQCWMKENMNIGTMTAGVNNQGADCPSAAAIEKYCYSDNTDNCTTYGGLYQWDQAMCGSTTAGAVGICPSGWHIPTDSEQYTLENYLTDSGQTCNATRVAWDCSAAGTKLQSGGSSGFEGLLAGGRTTDGSFQSQSTYANIWSSSESATSAWYRYLDSGYATVNRYANNQAYGFSVRCLKD